VSLWLRFGLVLDEFGLQLLGILEDGQPRIVHVRL
jgi:hypothetical protein